MVSVKKSSGMPCRFTSSAGCELMFQRTKVFRMFPVPPASP